MNKEDRIKNAFENAQEYYEFFHLTYYFNWLSKGKDIPVESSFTLELQSETELYPMFTSEPVFF